MYVIVYVHFVGVLKTQFMKKTNARNGKLQDHLKCCRNFCLAISNTGTIAMHYQLPLCFVFVYISRGTSGYDKYFRGFFMGKGWGNSALSGY